MYELKIYWEVICHDNEEWCKTWSGIDLSVQNWLEQFDNWDLDGILLTKVENVWA